MRLSRRTIKTARIEIIPMIDTIFFLLVFFMISTLAEDTMFDYNCTIWETRTYRHSLQYNIRWIMEVRTRDNRFTNRQI